MTYWIIEPQDPLIVRDGRPFNATPGARARSLPFPFPSTIAGGVRTRAGQDNNGLFDKAKVQDVKQITVRGPLLVEIKEDDAVKFLAPAPADALVLDEENSMVCRKWLRPLRLDVNAKSDKPNEITHLVGLPHPDSSKPAREAPCFWHWGKFEEWLLNPADDTQPHKLTDLGHNGPQPDRRIHVAIDPASFTGKDGDLFLTSGLTFWHQSQNEADTLSNAALSQTKKLGLALEAHNLGQLTISAGFAHLGGERRLMNWREQEGMLPQKPPDLVKRIMQNNGHCRLILLTPGYFKHGWRPDQFGGSSTIKVLLKAAAVPKPDVVSGWDFEKGGPKAARRLAPAGSVYFVKVEGDVAQWVEDRWLRTLSDDAEFAKAGFGLTAVGVWDGNPQPVKIDLQEKNNA